MSALVLISLSKCGPWHVECKSIQRSFLSHVSIFNLLTYFFVVVPPFCSSFCFPWISLAEMKCQCAGIAAEQTWCATVLHMKADRSELCRACHIPLSPAVSPLSVYPNPFSVFHSLLIDFLSSSVLCTTATMGISVGHAHCCLQFNRQMFLQCLKSLLNRSTTWV